MRLSPNRSIAVIGGGPAGLMAAELLVKAGARVTVYDQMPSLGRKFLMAGRGGLNLTHSEDLKTFLTRYGDINPLLRTAIETYPPAALRAWSDSLGQPTFIGTSGRVFPTVLKTSPLLRTWLLRLGNLGVEFKLRHRWEGWDEDGNLRFTEGEQNVIAEPDAIVLALGGGSWPKLGSDAGWVDIMGAEDVEIAPLQAANCGFTAAWSEVFRSFEGEPLKNIGIAFNGRSVRGEAMITRDGIEGGTIYALSSSIRDAVMRDGTATITIDLMPEANAAKLTERLSKSRGKQSLSNFLRKQTHLSAASLALLREAALASKQSLPALTAEKLAALIKATPVRLTGVQPMATAISTAGGVSFSELDERFMLKRYPGIFIAGEMLDWDAPTGGYLLQASFATGAAAARGAIAWLQPPPKV
ncbi:MAG TPA: TIGR03862 family flavoprotein [Pseudolabrys sp.]